MNKEIKYDKRNSIEIQNLMNLWRQSSNLLKTDTFKYIIRKEYKTEDLYIEIITNRPGSLIGKQGVFVKEFTNKLIEFGIVRVDILDTYKIHTVYPKIENNKGD